MVTLRGADPGKTRQPRPALPAGVVRPGRFRLLGFRGRGEPGRGARPGARRPLLAAAVWGLFVAPKAVVPLNVPLRLVPEVLVFGSAVAALLATGHTLPAACLAVLATVNRPWCWSGS